MLAQPGQWPCKVRNSRGEQCALVYNHYGAHATLDDIEAAGAAGAPPVLVWSYPGRTQADAGQAFSAHAGEMFTKGYNPVSQSWGEGRPGIGRVFALGDTALAIRPKGFLTVTYQLRQPTVPVTAPVAPDPVEQLRKLAELRDAGIVSAQEFEAKKAELLSRM